MSEQEKTIETLRSEILNLNIQISSYLSDMSNLKDEKERQSNEINRLNEEIDRLNDCVNQTETSLREYQLKYKDKSDEVYKLKLYIVLIYLSNLISVA